MTDLRDKIEIDIENIDRLFKELPSCKVLPQLSILELAGVATMLHNFYSGSENIIKRILIDKEIPLPTGSSWHKDLLNLAAEHGIISQNIKERLGEFLAFRHYFSHAYAIDLYAERMEPLVKSAPDLFEHLKIEVSRHY